MSVALKIIANGRRKGQSSPEVQKSRSPEGEDGIEVKVGWLSMNQEVKSSEAELNNC